jgi:hypothetical protein
MEESFESQSGEEFENPKIIRWEVDVYINGVKDTTWQFTNPEDLETFKKEEVAKNSESDVTFSEPRELEEDVTDE